MKHHHHSFPASSCLAARAGLSIAIATTVLALAACASPHPDSVFHSRTDFNRDVGTLFKILIAFGTMIFLIVEGVLVFTLIRFRRRGVAKRPAQVQGNTTLEIVWTIIPMVILLFIA